MIMKDDDGGSSLLRFVLSVHDIWFDIIVSCDCFVSKMILTEYFHLSVVVRLILADARGE